MRALALALALALAVAGACGDDGQDEASATSAVPAGSEGAQDDAPSESPDAPTTTEHEPETLGLSDLSVGLALRDIEASDLVDTAGGGVFAINDRLDAVTLYELNAVDGGSAVEVLDRSAEIKPPWGTFQGSEMASVGHARSGSDHALVIVENQVSGQLLTASSTDDGATWTTTLSAGTRCGSHDQRTYITGPNIGSVSHEACDSGTPGLVWQGPLGGGIELTGSQLPVFNYTDAMCNTDEVAVQLHDDYDVNAAGSFYALWTSTDGISWEHMDVPGGFGTPQSSDQKWLSCTGEGFIAAAESSGWRFAADGSFIGQFDTPEGAERFSTSHAYLFAWGFRMPLQVSDDGGATWNEVAGTLGEITDAAASADGHIWVLSDGDLYSTASAVGPCDDIVTAFRLGDFQIITDKHAVGCETAVAVVQEYFDEAGGESEVVYGFNCTYDYSITLDDPDEFAGICERDGEEILFRLAVIEGD